MNSQKSIVLRAENIFKSFIKGTEEIRVIRGINLSIHTGEMIAITGASGVGKSTLLHILGTLDFPSSGQILVGEKQENVFQFSEKRLALFRNQQLGFVFQFHYLLPEFSAIENVMMPALIQGQKHSVAMEKARLLLEEIGLKHRLNHRPGELSGGEQQRVAIARAVILHPPLLMADELTGNLDFENRSRILDLLIQLNQTLHLAIILVTHDRDLANKMHRIIHMHEGVFC